MFDNHNLESSHELRIKLVTRGQGGPVILSDQTETWSTLSNFMSLEPGLNEVKPGVISGDVFFFHSFVRQIILIWH